MGQSLIVSLPRAEVQKDAYEEWFRPTLLEAGYEGIFQPKLGATKPWAGCHDFLTSSCVLQASKGGM